ncbi:c-type cytochrome [Sphingobacterium sp. SYP-B4668]|uniref:c-type cytochrome n=1 Tax=Sphingobacterium sp. SYP-B4668 TaxID=2996035 RepID=UPI0022DDA6C4|nr:c-type cytochrome [Sphingobacterium sp. SYP-B4668]
MKITLDNKWLWIVAVVLISGCRGSTATQEIADSEMGDRRRTYIRAIAGEDEEIAAETIQRGKVLLSYSDCYSCHRESKKTMGPSFQDIGLRYPRTRTFIRVLAQRVIHGGSGAWGNAVMSPHRKLPVEQAEAMVAYILSIPSE